MLKLILKHALLPFSYTMMFLCIAGCVKDEGNSLNHLPVAKFEVDSYRGDVNTVFYFDAGMVSDEEDPVEQLEIRWDWTNNGVYDTEYSTTKTATHQYTQAGQYFPLLKVRDTKGMVDSITKMVVVVRDLDNQPPNKPKYISPDDWQTWIDPTHIFKWSCTDPDDDELMFDVWLGTRATRLTLFSKDIETNKIIENGKATYTATFKNLALNQDYFWRIYAHDEAGNYTGGDIWKFTTRPE